MQVRFRLPVLLALVALVGLASALAALFPKFWLESILGCLTIGIAALAITRREPLRFFLRYINPVLAVIVLVTCLFAASVDDGTYGGFFHGGIPTYFFAKGIFCATTLFLLGNLVEHMMFK